MRPLGDVVADEVECHPKFSLWSAHLRNWYFISQITRRQVNIPERSEMERRSDKRQPRKGSMQKGK
jgi:hypothetical protein